MPLALLFQMQMDILDIQAKRYCGITSASLSLEFEKLFG
jgi:hypothetical protein